MQAIIVTGLLAVCGVIAAYPKDVTAYATKLDRQVTTWMSELSQLRIMQEIARKEVEFLESLLPESVQ